MSRIFCFLLAGIASLLLVACGSDKASDDVRLNHLQIVGTHNSYHVQMPADVLQVISTFDPVFAKQAEYGHAPLGQQLQAGIRSVELDAYADPAGGRYSGRQYMAAFGKSEVSGLDQLSQPGFKVLHAPEADFLSTCWTLNSCLTTIRDWSDANPDHLPVMVFIQPTDAPVPDPLKVNFPQPWPIGRAELDALDQEILAVFSRDRIVTPDDVRGNAATLRDAVTTKGWPTLDASRGKVLFAMIDDTGKKRDAYIDANGSLAGRVMFTTPDSDQPDAAIIKLDDPVASYEQITALVRAGFIVRTRADADTNEARVGDTRRRDLALTSGAQVISTDYALSPAPFGRPYQVTLPSGGLFGCNPVVTSPSRCSEAKLESLDSGRLP